jgi:hypothetical protein
VKNGTAINTAVVQRKPTLNQPEHVDDIKGRTSERKHTGKALLNLTQYLGPRVHAHCPPPISVCHYRELRCPAPTSICHLEER